MRLQELIGKVHVKLHGKPATKAPQPGSPKYEVYTSIANDVLQSWAQLSEYKGKPLNWKVLRREVRGVIRNNRLILPDEYLRLIDGDITVDGQPVPLIQKSERFGRVGVYEDGYEEAYLTFTGDMNGKIAECGIIVAPPNLSRPNSEVVCDSTRWLVAAIAAEVAVTTSSKVDVIDDLRASAADEFAAMISALRPKVRGARRHMKRLPSRVMRFY